MPVQMSGEIDIVPPLTWSEVQPTGFMELPSYTPRPADGRLAALRCELTVIPQPEGLLQVFTFPAIIATTANITGADRALFTAQVQEIVSAFPTHVFGGVTRLIRFKGDVIEDVWRVGVAANGITVGRQAGQISWVTA